jgi:hypothetical protein
MDGPLAQAYKRLEEDIKAAREERWSNQSVMSTGLEHGLLEEVKAELQ